MSGHSKWHNIAAKKGKADAARGKVFTKLGRELLIAVKQGGPDPAGRSAIFASPFAVTLSATAMSLFCR